MSGTTLQEQISDAIEEYAYEHGLDLDAVDLMQYILEQIDPELIEEYAYEHDLDLDAVDLAQYILEQIDPECADKRDRKISDEPYETNGGKAFSDQEKKELIKSGISKKQIEQGEFLYQQLKESFLIEND